ncbi:small GTPase superfamily rab type protein [Podospora fimiseda]|uniref:Small GTPase superfamily rab type protein n=1 Tax=Podospora fimiseda TaxID=252190 RepID=A0AAN7BXC7_9PEZI|nr:small GTPase superfamily rab type protein [Podospora fimiseda]
MGLWLTELRRNLPSDIVLHVVGTKADIVARDPSKREVPFERCIAYVAENLTPGRGSTPPPTASLQGSSADNKPPTSSGLFSSGNRATLDAVEPKSPSSKRSSGFWGQEVGWDACHEISAESGEGVEEVFRVVTRKLVEQNRKMQAALSAATGYTPGELGTPFPSAYGGGELPGGAEGYFDAVNPRGGSFRVGRDRRSWIFSPGFSTPAADYEGGRGEGWDQQGGGGVDGRRGKCC